MTELTREQIEITERLVRLGRARADLQAKREELRKEREAVDAELRDTVEAARAVKLSWGAINDAAKLGSVPQSAQVFASRRDQPTPPQRPAEWLTLTAAAKRLGVGHVTLKARLADPDDPLTKRVTVIPPEQAGYKSPRYVVADE